MSIARIAVVTGAGRGLGERTAYALADAGFGIVVATRSSSPVAQAIEQGGGEAVALPLDVSDPTSIERFADALPSAVAERWGRGTIDVLVNNAGVGRFAPLDAIRASDIDDVFATNVRGTMLVTAALAPLIIDGGSIVTVSSSLTRHVSAATSVYAASKAAVEAFSRSIAGELGPRGIRVNVIAPGPTATDFNGGAMRDDGGLRAQLAASTALGRVGHPREIADAITALVSPGLRWLTAERVEVSGGVLL